MKEALIALNTITRDGVIRGYAIGGAIGASFYIEAMNTEDIDAFVFLDTAENSLLLTLTPIYDALQKLGGIIKDEYVVIGNWPVQIIPPRNALVEEAIRNAQDAEYFGIPTRVFTAEYLCAIALDTGRTKDYYRVGTFLESDAVDTKLLKQLVIRHELSDKLGKLTNQTGLTL